MKKVLAFLLSFAIIAGMFQFSLPVFAAGTQAKTGDDGTTNWDFIVPVTHQKTVPAGYTGIYTAQDLANITSNLSGNYILMGNIDLAGWGNWTPIGDASSNAFAGIFDGNGYVINNLTINGSVSYAGLFGNSSSETIKSVGLSLVNIAIQNTMYFCPYTGGICGSSDGSIGNCYVSGNVSGTYKSSSDSDYASSCVGGICGNNSGTINNCYNAGIVTADATALNNSACSYAGGICGNGGSISICYNSGNVFANSRLLSALSDNYSAVSDGGGICGFGGNILDCYNNGTVSTNAISPASVDYAYTAYSNAGGICGDTGSGSTNNNCYNDGTVSALSSSYSYAGGISGDTSSNCTTSYCHNTGSISGASSYSFSYVGGICGEIISGNSISNCYNTGDVSAISSSDYPSLSGYAGGICGSNYSYNNNSSTIINCYNNGIISASFIAGGICGDGNFENISACHNTGNISVSSPSSDTEAGGICGNGGNISNCYNDGAVSAVATSIYPDSAYSSVSYSGGICGIGDRINSCYNVGTISASSYNNSSVSEGGGICGNGGTINNCYNIGAVSAESTYSSNAGGICGYNVMDGISCCYNFGAISASSNYSIVYVGGICGESYYQTVSNCIVLSYSIVAESSNPTNQYNYTIGHNAIKTNNLALSNISGNPINDANGVIIANEAQQKSTYENLGWDFDTTWAIDPNFNNGYPYLQAIPPATPSSSGTTINLNRIVSDNSDPTVYSGYVGQQTMIAGTYTSPSLVPSASSVTWSCSDPAAVTFGNMTVNIGGSTTNATISIPVTCNKAGTYTITASTTDGASTTITIDISEYTGYTPAEIQSYGGQYIAQHGTLLYMPVIDGKTYYCYAINNGRVTYGSSSFSITPQSTNTKYLLSQDGTGYSVVSSLDVLVKAAYVDLINDTLVRNSSNTQYTTAGLQSTLNTMSSMESKYQTIVNDYNLGSFLVGAGQFLLGVTGAYIQTCVGNVDAPLNFLGDQIIDQTASAGDSAVTFDTSQFLNSMRTQAGDVLRTEYAQVASSLNKLSNGYLCSYDDCVALSKTNYLLGVWDDYFKMDLKYIVNKVDEAKKSAVIDSALALLGVGTSYFDSDTIDAVIDCTTKVIDGVSMITTEISDMTDPDLKQMMNSLDSLYESFKSSIYPAESISWCGNLTLLNTAPAQALDQTVVVSCPVDITVYTKGGQQIGQITNNVVDTSYNYDPQNPLVMMVDGNSKVLMFPAANDYQIKINATGAGVMNYLQNRVDANGDSVSTTGTYNISLTTNAAFAVNSQADIDYQHLFSGSTPASVVITVTAGSGGTVSGDNGYVNGSDVHLVAVPDIGYIFDGWYENNIKISGADAVYSFAAIADRTLEARFTSNITLPGDVNGDGKVDLRDATLVMQYYAKLIDGSALNLAAADVNGDGKVDLRDATLIMQYYAKLITTLGS